MTAAGEQGETDYGKYSGVGANRSQWARRENQVPRESQVLARQTPGRPAVLPNGCVDSHRNRRSRADRTDNVCGEVGIRIAS